MKSSRSLLSNLDKMYRALNSERKNGNSPTTWRSYNERCKHPAFIVPEALRAEHQAFGNTSLGGRSRVHCQNGGTSWSQGLSQITVLRCFAAGLQKGTLKMGEAFSVHFNELILILIHFSCAFPCIFPYFCKRPWFLSCKSLNRWHQKAVNMLQAASLFLPIWMAHLHDVSTEVIREWQLPVGSWEVESTTWSQQQQQQQPSTNSQNSLWNDVKAKARWHTWFDWIELFLPSCQAGSMMSIPSEDDTVTSDAPQQTECRELQTDLTSTAQVLGKHRIFPFGEFYHGIELHNLWGFWTVTF